MLVYADAKWNFTGAWCANMHGMRRHVLILISIIQFVKFIVKNDLIATFVIRK